MTVLDDLVKAIEDAPCIERYTSIRCHGPQRKHPGCAVAAVLRALKESEAVMAVGKQAAAQRWCEEANHDATWGFVHGIAAIARLADEVQP